jgi:serine/threonine protein kinase
VAGPASVLGPFELLEKLGEGTFGTVCVARVSGDPGRRTLAVKILKPEVAVGPNMQRTRDEARLLSRLDHPHIVRVERLLEVDGTPMIVMEHVKGASFGDLLELQPDGIPASVALEAMRATCLALDAAFNHPDPDGKPLRVIHRDVKPSNTLMSTDGVVKVVDFGTAQSAFDGREAQTRSIVLGSRPYMAPERLDGAADAPSLDVYSVGISLFELLTGKLPILSVNQSSHEAALKRQLPFVTVAGAPDDVVAAVQRLIGELCAYVPEQRPTPAAAASSIAEVAALLPPELRVTLAEYARDVVQPLYDQREVRPPPAYGRASTPAAPQRGAEPRLWVGTALAIAGSVALVAALIVLAFAWIGR